MPLGRAPDVHQAYMQELARRQRECPDECFLCTAPSMRDSNHWRLVTNTYPYEKYKTHHMLVLKEHRDAPSAREWEELRIWMIALSREYRHTVINLEHAMSQKNHYHVHLLSQ